MSLKRKEFFPGESLVSKSFEVYELVISPEARLTAPEGKYLALTINGVGKPILPGFYKGHIKLTVTDNYRMAPHSLMKTKGIVRNHHPAVCILDNAIVESCGVPAAVQGGVLDGYKADSVFIASEEPCFTGILVTGDSEYQVKNAEVYFDGDGQDDFSGMGAAVAAIDNARVTIDGCTFRFSGETRCAVHAGGDSEVHVKNSRISNHSDDSGRVGCFSWQVGFKGSNRLCQLTDDARVRYENCDLETNGWGILSIDGTGDKGVEMYIKDCRMTLEGTRAHGYGAFCIGDNKVTFDNCDVKVNGYPFMLMGMEGKGRAEIKNGCFMHGRRFGVMIDKDDNSSFKISDSAFDTGKSCIVMKGSATTVDITNTSFKAGNNVILQLMDNDEASMIAADFKIPVGVIDVPVEGRDLFTASATEDVNLNITDCDITGDFYNSTTNIRAYRNSTMGGVGYFQQTAMGSWEDDEVHAGEPEDPRHGGDDLQGPKNLGLNLKNSSITGVISAAAQSYRDGLNVIDPDNQFELSNITQRAAEPVNNGVIVALDGGSAWTVTGKSCLTALSLAPGARLAAPEGKELSFTVDGRQAVPAPGEYKGNIVLDVK